MELLKIQSIVSLGFVLFGYAWSRLSKRNDVADILWSLGFLAMGCLAYSYNTNPSSSQKVFMVCLALWSLRLALYLALRNLGKPEDKRYQNWREGWGVKEPIHALTRVFVLQSVLMNIISIPVSSYLLTANLPEPGPLMFLGLILFCLGFLIETASDFDLFQFKKQKQQGICQEGLWKYSRHPNYFGEILVWWGFATMAVQSELGMWVYVSPLFLTFLLMRVSGVSMTDKQMSQTKGEAFLKYQKTARSLLPFGFAELVEFLILSVFVFAVDLFFIGFLSVDFFMNQLGHLARLNAEGTGFDALIWAMLWVYFCLPLGIYLIVNRLSYLGSAILYSGIFGLCSYGIYEFTNLALIKDWPVSMAYADILWGTLLSAMSGTFLFYLRRFRVRT